MRRRRGNRTDWAVPVVGLALLAGGWFTVAEADVFASPARQACEEKVVSKLGGEEPSVKVDEETATSIRGRVIEPGEGGGETVTTFDCVVNGPVVQSVTLTDP